MKHIFSNLNDLVVYICTIIVWCFEIKKKQRCASFANSAFVLRKHNDQSPFTTDHWTLKNAMTYDVRNPGPGLGQMDDCGDVKHQNGVLK
jgi:hypothetical protein